jgi:hypothetical protein
VSEMARELSGVCYLVLCIGITIPSLHNFAYDAEAPGTKERSFLSYTLFLAD